MSEGKTKRDLFVVQEHHATRFHCDLRLLKHGIAFSWAIPKGISMNPGDARLAVRVSDHPPKSMKFTGTRRRGLYGAGEVLIWDEGEYEAFFLDDSTLIIFFYGQKLRGKFEMKKKPGNNDDWFLRKLEDKYSDPTFVFKPLLKPRRHKGFEPLFEVLD